MRHLIVNADDFGLSAGVNRGIVQAHAQGIVTSATLMANSRACAEAVALARSHSELSVGAHVVLIDGQPLLPATQISTLLGRDTRFRDSFVDFGLATLRGRISAEQVQAEATAQFRKLLAAGVALTHFDTHKHVHMFTAILKPLLRAARACGVRAVRNPFAPFKPLAFAHLARRPRLWTRYSEVKAVRRMATNFRSQVDEAGLITTDGTFGIVTTGALDLRLFEAIVGCVPEGTWEFVCHPGYNDVELRGVRTRLRDSREQELRVLTSAEAKACLTNAGIELISYRELVKMAAV